MIISNRKHAIGSKCGTIHTVDFRCVVSTAKEGLFAKQSTAIIEGDMVNDRTNCRCCAKIVYANSLSSSDRLRFHDIICDSINDIGENGGALGDALYSVIANLKEKGVVSEAMNLTSPSYES